LGRFFCGGRIFSFLQTQFHEQSQKVGFGDYSDDIVLDAGDELELDLGMDKIA
jgi:hypothetical protein